MTRPRPPRKLGHLQLDLLDSLAAGVHDLRTLSEDTGHDYDSVRLSMRRLIDRGYVYRVHGREYGGHRGSGPASYALTVPGREALRRAVSRGRAPGVRVGAR